MLFLWIETSLVTNDTLQSKTRAVWGFRLCWLTQWCHTVGNTAIVKLHGFSLCNHVFFCCSNSFRQNFMLYLCPVWQSVGQEERWAENLSAGRLHCCLSTGKCPLGASYNFNGSPEESSTNNGSYGIYYTLLIQLRSILPDMARGCQLLKKIILVVVFENMFSKSLIKIERISEPCVILWYQQQAFTQSSEE